MNQYRISYDRKKQHPNLIDKYYICFFDIYTYDWSSLPVYTFLYFFFRVFNLHAFNTFQFMMSNSSIICQSIISMLIILTCSHLHSRSSKVINVVNERWWQYLKKRKETTTYINISMWDSVLNRTTRQKINVWLCEGERRVRYLARNETCLSTSTPWESSLLFILIHTIRQYQKHVLLFVKNV